METKGEYPILSFHNNDSQNKQLLKNLLNSTSKITTELVRSQKSKYHVASLGKDGNMYLFEEHLWEIINFVEINQHKPSS